MCKHSLAYYVPTNPLTMIFMGLFIGIVWVPLGYWMGVISVKRVAEADERRERPEFLQEAADSYKENDMALTAEQVQRRYDNE